MNAINSLSYVPTKCSSDWCWWQYVILNFRLEAYDRNFNFRGEQITLPKPDDVVWPLGGFQQLQVAHKMLLPKITEEQIESYFIYRMAGIELFWVMAWIKCSVFVFFCSVMFLLKRCGHSMCCCFCCCVFKITRVDCICILKVLT